jgi:putative heme-binding domain-containing protein
MGFNLCESVKSVSFIFKPPRYNARVKQFIAILFLVGNLSAADSLPPEKVNTLIEALGRLDPALVNGNPALKERLNQVLDAVRGEPRSVALIKKFQVQGREADLLAVAAKYPNDPAGVEALGMVLAGDGKKAVAALLVGKDAKQAAAVARALGYSNNQKVIPLLAPLVTNTKLHVNVRKEAVKGLANFEAGAKLLLGLAKAGTLPQSAKFTASLALSAVRWPAIKAEAAKVLPPPFGANAKPLPPVAELAKRKGDVANGAKIFLREAVQCARCHKVGDAGIEVGPALTEIGDKLPKEELYASILDPSAGISFGYEVWLVLMKDGNAAFGIIESEMDDEISVKGPTGAVTKHAKANIKSRAQQPVSLMPPGLHLTMKEAELVDLIEYLASLKKR